LLWTNTVLAGAKSHFVYPQPHPEREIAKTVDMTFVPPEYNVLLNDATNVLNSERGDVQMSDLLDAAEGAIALLCGGFIFLLFGSALGTTGLIDLSLWGIVYVLVGIVVLVTAAAAAAGAVISEVV
jgi:hypothetical protein